MEYFAHLIEEQGDCWIWKGLFKQDSLFPIVAVNSKCRYVHRYLYEKHVGPITKRYLMQTCKNRSCVNPNHMQERSTALELKGPRVFKNSEIAEILERNTMGETVSKLSREFKTRNPAIYELIKKHLHGPGTNETITLQSKINTNDNQEETNQA